MTEDLEVREEFLQPLWGGYGRLVRRVRGEGRCIVKDIRWPSSRTDASHQRKLESYRVESRWYAQWAPQVPDHCRLPELLEVHEKADGLVLVLEDLDAAGFRRRTSSLSGSDLHGALDWLAGFHAAFLGKAPEGLWPEGSYWHLETRREEYRAMPSGKLRTMAPELDRKLRGAKFRTLVHGDAKPDNFCLGRPGQVAAVDFQYVGGGTGMRDVAYLLDCVHDEPPAGTRTRASLDLYFSLLRGHLLADPRHAPVAEAVEEEWRTLHPVAWLDYQRFLAGWRPG